MILQILMRPFGAICITVMTVNNKCNSVKGLFLRCRIFASICNLNLCYGDSILTYSIGDDASSILIPSTTRYSMEVYYRRSNNSTILEKTTVPRQLYLPFRRK